MKKIKAISSSTMMLLMLQQSAFAMDVDAGDYAAAPGGTNLFLLYYQHANRDASYTAGVRNPGNSDLKSDVGILRAIRYVDVGDYIVAPQVLLPFGQVKAGGSIAALGENAGVGDIILAAPFWLNKADAKRQYAITPYLTLPTGQYDQNEPLSLGEHRWRFTLQAGSVQPITDKLALEVIGDVQVHGKNDKYGAAGATLKRKPQYEAQTFLRYSIAQGADLRVGLQSYFGGENRVNGINQNDRQATTRLQFGGSKFITSTTQLTATGGRDLSVHNGFKEAYRLNLRLLQLL